MQTGATHCWKLAREPRCVLFWRWRGSTALSRPKVHVVNALVFYHKLTHNKEQAIFAKPKF